MASQPIRPALDIPDVKEQLGLIVNELAATNTKLETVVALANSLIGPLGTWLITSSELQLSLRKLRLSLWFFLFGTPLAIVLLALLHWFKPAQVITQPHSNHYFIGATDVRATVNAAQVTAFSGPMFGSGSDSDCLVGAQEVDCADLSHWASGQVPLKQFLNSHPNPRAWFLQTGHDRDRLGKLALDKFGSNHGLALARFHFLKQAILMKLPELKSAAQLPPFLRPEQVVLEKLIEAIKAL